MRYLDKSSSGFVSVNVLLDYFKAECLKRLENGLPSRKNSQDTSRVNDSGNDDLQNKPPSRKGSLNKVNEREVDELETQSQRPMVPSAALPPPPSLETPITEPIDWDTYPLPPDGFWEIRIDKKTGKVSF